MNMMEVIIDIKTEIVEESTLSSINLALDR